MQLDKNTKHKKYIHTHMYIYYIYIVYVLKVLYIIVSYHIYECIIQMRIIIYRRILFQIKRMEGAENRSVKSLFIYFKNCESNSFIKKIIYTRCGTRGEIVS